MSRRAFSTASRADNRSISPISRWLPARTHSPPSPARTATRTAARSAIAVCGLQHRPGLSHLRLPAPRLRPRAGAQPHTADHGAQPTRPVAGPDTPNRQNLPGNRSYTNRPTPPERGGIPLLSRRVLYRKTAMSACRWSAGTGLEQGDALPGQGHEGGRGGQRKSRSGPGR
jgi:hypothetical protein